MSDRLASIFGDCNLASMVTLGRAGGCEYLLSLLLTKSNKIPNKSVAFR